MGGGGREAGAAGAATGANGGRLAATLRAFRHRNYRLYFGGQGVSLIGTWITRVAMSWLVYRLTGSAEALGIVSFASLLPTFLLAPFAGVWVDRLDRYRVIIVTQVLSMLQSFALAALALSGTIVMWHIIALSIAQGFINAFDMPARQAFLVEMVEDREDLPNAIALNSSMFNGARLVGPSVAGALVAIAGEGWAFLIDGISYIAVLVSLFMMHVKARELPVVRASMLAQLRDGVRYAVGFAPIRAVLILLAVSSLLGMPYLVLMPVIASQTLHGDASTFGWLMAATGVGALSGALYLASRRSVLGLGRAIAVAASCFGVGLVAFSFSRSLALSLLLLVVAGAGFMVQTASSNTVLQTVVTEDMRGRLMAFYTMAFMGTAPFGSLISGWVADRIGAPETIMAGGAAIIVAGAVFGSRLPALRKLVRPIYVERGILPEIATGLQSASVLTAEGEPS
ncbi:MAG TPA: MFS transporter [Gemmatimonadaceae bacterium]|nr:MFS transporter [Gemmatimonadaceae bacterium]